MAGTHHNPHLSCAGIISERRGERQKHWNVEDQAINQKFAGRSRVRTENEPFGGLLVLFFLVLLFFFFLHFILLSLLHLISTGTGQAWFHWSFHPRTKSLEWIRCLATNSAPHQISNLELIGHKKFGSRYLLRWSLIRNRSWYPVRDVSDPTMCDWC